MSHGAARNDIGKVTEDYFHIDKRDDIDRRMGISTKGEIFLFELETSVP